MSSEPAGNDHSCSDGLVALRRRRMVMARSWAEVILEPLDVWYHDRTYQSAGAGLITEHLGQVRAKVSLRVRYGLSSGTRIVAPTVLQSGSLTGFLDEARKLCRREVREAGLAPECGMDVTYGWLDPDTKAVERGRTEGWLTKAFCEPVLRVSFEYQDSPIGDPGPPTDWGNPPWWQNWLHEHGAFADAPWQVSVAFQDVLATRAQFERLMQSVESLIEVCGGRRV